MPDYTQEFTTIPYGPLGIIALPGCEELAQKIDRYLVKWRAQKQSEHKNSLSFAEYERDTYIIDASFPRFGSGEGKGSLHESVRGYDIFIVCDMFNYGVKKLIGAYAAAMGGVDAIIFTAGVGENSASQRMAIASGLEFMGVKMDEDANKVRGEERVISAPDSKVTVLLIPTNEELMIAMDTEMLVG